LNSYIRSHESIFMRYLTILTLLLLSGCSALTGEEVGRLAINQLSSADNLIKKEASVVLKPGDEIAFWSEMDMEYEGEPTIRFRISITKDGKDLGSMEVDPRKKDMTLGEVKTSIGDKTSWSFSGRGAIIPITEEGNYTFEAILLASDNPTLVIKKAELVLKKI
jgi:hypothetical protein